MSAGVKACSGKFWRAHLLMCRKFSAAQERCPPEKTIRHSLFAIRCRFGSAEILLSYFVHRLKSVAAITKPAEAG